MTHYIHHVPGRLRVKTPVIKRNDSEAKYAKGLLEKTEGVLGIDVNIATGSILINYDPRVGNGEAILGTLRGRGYLHHRVLPARDQPVMHLGQRFSDILLNKVVETVLERSASALIAALI